MKTTIVPALTLLLAVSSTSAQQGDLRERPRTVTVRGFGSINAPPDQIRLSVQVNTRASSASEAMAQASVKTRDILAILKNMGVDTKDIQTTRVTVNPIVDYQRNIQPPPIVGYTGINDFNVVFKGKLMDRVGEFMDKAVTAGASGFGSLMYENSKQRELEREAMKKAAADAQARAVVLAMELGANVGKIMTISESYYGPIPMGRASAMVESATVSTPVMTGELTISAQVETVFELK
jgi:uncharacterized protein YggE